MELSMHVEKQDCLRVELLSAFSSTDPTYEELTSPALPYLEAVPFGPGGRRGPLKNLIRTESGVLVDKIRIRKGMILMVPLYYTNVARSIWDDDAAEFNPER
ncbi:hypothetical protein B0H13DRAFT_2351983 [Mycena leptocephala]|nr:hypothetical protein B0H13DRAFT_2351983 [Mycena leptocephala]